MRKKRKSFIDQLYDQQKLEILVSKSYFRSLFKQFHNWVYAADPKNKIEHRYQNIIYFEGSSGIDPISVKSPVFYIRGLKVTFRVMSYNFWEPNHEVLMRCKNVWVNLYRPKSEHTWSVKKDGLEETLTETLFLGFFEVLVLLTSGLEVPDRHKNLLRFVYRLS